jgi:hypothetical protein
LKFQILVIKGRKKKVIFETKEPEDLANWAKFYLLKKLREMGLIA